MHRRIERSRQSPQTMSVPARTIEECLSEELGRLYPDEIYAEVVTQGWDLNQFEALNRSPKQ